MENKIAYREAFLAEKRASIHGAHARRTMAKPGTEIPENARLHADQQRDEALADVDRLEARWLEPLRQEYRDLMGLD